MDDYKDHGISKQLFRRQIISFLIIGFLLFMTVVFFASYASFLGFLSLMLVFILLFLFLYQNNQDFKAVSILCEHIKQLYNGNNEYHSFVPANSPIAESALQLNNISEGVKKSVDQQVKAERIKIDLVTNVSHDLKTSAHLDYRVHRSAVQTGIDPGSIRLCKNTGSQGRAIEKNRLRSL